MFLYKLGTLSKLSLAQYTNIDMDDFVVEEHVALLSRYLMSG